jgi:Transposase, Mutator family.
MALPSKYRISLRTSNIIERENREIRRREKVNTNTFLTANQSFDLLEQSSTMITMTGA